MANDDEDMICWLCGKKIANEKWNACDLGYTCESCSSKCPAKCQPPCPLKK